MDNHRKFSLFCIAALLVILAAGCDANTAKPTMVGFWADPENNVTAIEDQNGSPAAVSVYNLNEPNSQNTLVSSLFAYRVLTWRYCPPAKPCLTLNTVSVTENTLDVKWVSANGESGQMTLKRVDKGAP